MSCPLAPLYVTDVPSDIASQWCLNPGCAHFPRPTSIMSSPSPLSLAFTASHAYWQFPFSLSIPRLALQQPTNELTLCVAGSIFKSGRVDCTNTTLCVPSFNLTGNSWLSRRSQILLFRCVCCVKVMCAAVGLGAHKWQKTP